MVVAAAHFTHLDRLHAPVNAPKASATTGVKAGRNLCCAATLALD